MGEPGELSEAEAEALARAVQAGEDVMVLPIELIEDGPPAGSDQAAAQSLYARVLTMTMGEKIKLALRGNKDARTILSRDSSKLVRRFVLQNARITDGEVIALARSRNVDEDMMRIITDRREWMRNYQVKLAVVTNPKAPLPVALRLLGTLAERDLRTLGKSKNVPEAVAAHARRILFSRTERSG